jgi:adenylylsulfate kinase-like enzyme
MIIVLFGQPGSGKTTLANRINADFYIDGDDLRELFSNTDYSREGRMKNLNRASDIAVYLNNLNKTVCLSLVYPYKEARDYLTSLAPQTLWVYLHTEEDRSKFHVEDFEYPDKTTRSIDTTKSIDKCANVLLHHFLKHSFDIQTA